MKKDKKNIEKDIEFEGCENVDKTNNVLKVIIGILAFVIVVSSCFGAGYLGAQLGNKTNENKEESEKVEKLTVDSQVVKDLYEVFREDKDCSTATYWEDFSADEAKKFIAYRAAVSQNSKDIRCGDLDHSYVDGYYCAFHDEASQYYGDKEMFENAIKDEKTVGVTEDVLNAKYKELFGKDSVVSNGNLPLGIGPILYYDKVNKLYAEFGCQCGGECAGVTQTLDNISQDGTNLILNTTVVENLDGVTKYSVSYTFELEKETDNYIFVSRVEK